MTIRHLDERLSLSFVEAVLLWALRADAAAPGGALDGDEVRLAMLERALQRAGLDGVQPHLLGILRALRAGPLGSPVLHGLDDTRISADERAILDLPGLVHAGRGIAAVMAVRQLVAPAFVGAVLADLRRLAEVAAAAGHGPEEPDCTTARFAMPRFTPQLVATAH